jgi:hypothetical protein
MDRYEDKKVRFDMTINLGHILIVLSFLVTASVAWNGMDKRVAVLEEFRATQRDRDTVQDLENKEKFKEVRDVLVDMRRSMEKIADKVGAK